VNDGSAASECGTNGGQGEPADASAASIKACHEALTGADGTDAEVNSPTTCFPDHDGICGGSYTIDVTVDDTGFSKTVIGTQNDAYVTLTLRNIGTKPHGFAVECTSVTPAYPSIPKGCPSIACFPANSIIAPLEPCESKTIMFATPTPDSLLYPIKSTEPSDCDVPGLNGSGAQWSLM
jgi:hypothetical protein